MGELGGYKAVMQWFFSTHFNAVRMSDVFGRSEQDILREYVERYDWVLKEAAEYKPQNTNGRLKEEWPAALEKLGVKNKSESGNKSSNWDEHISILDHHSWRENKSVHVKKRVVNYDEIIEAFVYITTKLFERAPKSAELFWELFSSGSTTRSTGLGNWDHSYAYFWLDVVRLQNTDETLASEVREWVVDEFKKQKDKKSEESRDQDQKLQESDFGLSCADIHQLPVKFLRLRDRLLEIEGSEAINELLTRQGQHIRDIEDRAASESKRLPEVFHWIISGEDVAHVDLDWDEPGEEIEPVDSGTLASVLHQATKKIKRVRKKVLQVEASPALVQKVFDTLSAREDFYLDNLISNVSGFVLFPRIVSDDSFPRQKDHGSWYGIPRHDSDDAMCSTVEVEIAELKRRRRVKGELHLYLEYESSSSAIPDELYSIFQNCLLFFFHENQEVLNEFFTDDEFGNDRQITTPRFMKRLREVQLDLFSKAPRVLWQHPERKSKASTKKRHPAEYC